MIARLLIATTLLATACGDGVPGLSVGSRPIDGMWEAVELDGEPIEFGLTAAAPTYVDIDGRSFSGSFGCNNGGGTVDVDEDRLRFSEVFTELALCLPESAMVVEDALTSMFRVDGPAFEIVGDRMTWTSTDHVITFRSVSGPPTTTTAAAEPARSWERFGLDCGDEWAAEDPRVPGDGVEPLEMAQRYEPDVVRVTSDMPLWWWGEDADGVPRVLVLGHDDGTNDYQVVHCVPE